jgi:hypothetical protein
MHRPHFYARQASSDKGSGMQSEQGVPLKASVQAAFILRGMGVFLLEVVALWFIFYWLWSAFPYIRPGVQVIVDAKVAEMAKGELFAGAKPDQSKVAFFGHSQVLSGFVSDEFDRLSGGSTSSYNLGLPGENEYVGVIERMAAAGNKATHIFLILPWPAPPPARSLWYRLTHQIKWYESDDPIIHSIFPFRTMPRDLAVFLALSRGKGGVVAFYNYSREAAEMTLKDRGYYFIEGQSFYPNDQLPEDWTLSTDKPDEVYSREIVASGPDFDKLEALAKKYNFQYYLVPTYQRAHWRAAPPPINEETVKQLEGKPLFHVLGPDYWRYPNKDFADHVHTNEPGAIHYTTDLWNLTKHLFKK